MGEMSCLNPLVYVRGKARVLEGSAGGASEQRYWFRTSFATAKKKLPRPLLAPALGLNLYYGERYHFICTL